MDLFHFDIECVGEYPNFASFRDQDVRGATLFQEKFNKMNWSEKYESIEEAYLKQAGVITTYGKIVCISFGYLDNGQERIMSYYGDSEAEILRKFNDLLKKIEQKNFNLCGFRINHFDLPWILHKLHKHMITPANLIYAYDKKPWELRVVDLADDWKGKFAWGYSFDEMCYELNVPSPKVEMNGSEVHSVYWNGGLEKIKNYCELDIYSSILAAKKIYKSE